MNDYTIREAEILGHELTMLTYGKNFKGFCLNREKLFDKKSDLDFFREKLKSFCRNSFVKQHTYVHTVKLNLDHIREEYFYTGKIKYDVQILKFSQVQKDGVQYLKLETNRHRLEHDMHEPYYFDKSDVEVLYNHLEHLLKDDEYSVFIGEHKYNRDYYDQLRQDGFTDFNATKTKEENTWNSMNW